MQSIYWAVFCLVIWGIIFWSLRADDYGDFSARVGALGKKFTIKKAIRTEPDDHSTQNGERTIQ